MSAQALAAARQLFATGKTEQAMAQVRRVLQRSPADAEANDVLGGMLFRLGRMAQAEFHQARAAGAQSRNAVYRNNLANVLCATGRGAAAAAEYHVALSLSPGYFPSLIGLARALVLVPDLSGAAEAARQAEAIRPDLPDPYEVASIALTHAGLIEESIASVERGLLRVPGNPRLLAARVGATAYRDGVTPEMMREACVRAGASLGADERTASTRGVRTPLTGRALRVGVISADLRRHAVANFFVPIVEHLDPARVQLMCYSTAGATDDVTERIRKRAAGWIEAGMMPSAELAAHIRADAIDALIDLAGYSTGHRQSVMSRGAAPVQATYLGWPTTTGVPAVDWRIVDSITDPPGAERHGTERLLRLDPCFLCYEPPAEAPDVRAPAAPTFGSFNALPKLNAGTLALWSRVMRAAPEARLVLKTQGFADATCRVRIEAALAALGVASERVEIAGPVVGQRAHLDFYGRISVALDPFPYNGTTTTCEALWMGVPVVTRRGGMHMARVGESVLRAAGFGEWVAVDDEAYVARAVELLRGGSPAREEIRRRMAASVLVDGRAMAARFMAALERAWQGIEG
ncbi:MAG: hypothetical protein ACKVW3_05520 [Phycisphaerales bacterium]